MSDDAATGARVWATQHWADVIHLLLQDPDYVVDRDDIATELNSIAANNQSVSTQTAYRVLQALAREGLLDVVEPASGQRQARYKLNLQRWLECHDALDRHLPRPDRAPSQA